MQVHEWAGGAQLVTMFLLFRVHAAVGFDQELLGIHRIIGEKGLSDADGNDILAADFTPRGGGKHGELRFFLGHGLSVQAGHDQDKFVAAHARNIVVFATGLLQFFREKPEDAIPFQVPEAVVDLFEAIEVADEDGERGVAALARFVALERRSRST